MARKACSFKAGITAALIATSGLPALAQSQSSGETVWAAVVISTYGDRIPLISPDLSRLTPIGAQQLYSAGQLFRSRYIDPSSSPAAVSDNSSTNNAINVSNGSTPINANPAIIGLNSTIVGIAKDLIDNTQVLSYGLQEIFVQQSMQAFMAGLYPPSGNASASFNGLGSDDASTYANGTVVNSPLDGMQFPQYTISSSDDPTSVFLNGAANCPILRLAQNEYIRSTDYTSLLASTKPFYQSLGSALSGADPTLYAQDLSNSYEIYDWLAYRYLHGPAALAVNSSQLAYARSLADTYLKNLYGQAGVDGGVRLLAGRTLLSQVLAAFAANIETSGAQYKLSSYTVSFEPLMSMAALLQLSDFYDSFGTLPNPGSSMVFELFSPGANAPYPTSPMEQMRVRFLFRNGTNSPYNLDAYPIFGHAPNNGPDDLSLADFANSTQAVAIPRPEDWCLLCTSSAIFCAGETNGKTGLFSPAGTPCPSSSSSGPVSVQLPAAIGGVIGAATTIMVMALAFAVAVLVFGMRLHRQPGAGVIAAHRQSNGSFGGSRGPFGIGTRRSKTDSGGFKGTEKLESDVDLPSTLGRNSAMTIGASIMPQSSDAASRRSQTDTLPRGGAGSDMPAAGSHRRMESWELNGLTRPNGNSTADQDAGSHNADQAAGRTSAENAVDPANPFVTETERALAAVVRGSVDASQIGMAQTTRPSEDVNRCALSGSDADADAAKSASGNATEAIRPSTDSIRQSEDRASRPSQDDFHDAAAAALHGHEPVREREHV